jgi:hypothetical protein
VTRDGGWIGNKVYWTRGYTIQIAVTGWYSVAVFTVLLVNGSQRLTLSFRWVVGLFEASVTGF